MGRPTIGKRAMTDAERQRKRRARMAAEAATAAPKTKPAPAPAPSRPASDEALKAAQAEIARLRREIETLRRPEAEPAGSKDALKHLRQDNAMLRREIADLKKLAALPPDGAKRYRAFCNRWRAQMRAEIDDSWNRLREQQSTAHRRTGVISAALWRDLMLCTHPDSTPSKAVMERVNIGLREREAVLRAKK